MRLKRDTAATTRASLRIPLASLSTARFSLWTVTNSISPYQSPQQSLLSLSASRRTSERWFQFNAFWARVTCRLRFCGRSMGLRSSRATESWSVLWARGSATWWSIRLKDDMPAITRARPRIARGRSRSWRNLKLLVHETNFLFFFSLPPPQKVPPRISPFTFGDEPSSFGDTISIQCTIAGGDTPIDVVWKLNDKAIVDTHNDILLDKRGQRVHTLFIEAVKASHIGNYTCSATNRAGTVKHTSQLLVNGS